MLRVQKIEYNGHCNLGQSVLCNTVTPFMQPSNTKSTHSWMVLDLEEAVTSIGGAILVTSAIPVPQPEWW
jgi:hypothetical protein